MDEVRVPSDSKARLLRIARRTLEDFVQSREQQFEEIDDPFLQSREHGAFVSLHRGEELRGCMGTCSPSTSLYQTVIDMTQAAASRDSRVAPIHKTELRDIRIDISILSRLDLVGDPLLLKVGRHGLHIARDEKRGVLLPQVAIQYQWDIETFLEQTCLKAGLPKYAWKEPGTLVSAFSALIIEESI
jgi:AmmeMemoRadiSam system protein A